MPLSCLHIWMTGSTELTPQGVLLYCGSVFFYQRPAATVVQLWFIERIQQERGVLANREVHI